MGQKDLIALVNELDSLDFDPEKRLHSSSLGNILAEISFHANFRLWQFTPTHSASPRFFDRLEAWLGNPELLDADIATLLRIVPHIQFVDRDDMLTLYRTAFTGPVRRWLMDELGLDFSLAPEDLVVRLESAVNSTWFCSITDSMNISQFNHVNGISGQDHRPSWRTLRKFGDIEKVRKYLLKNGLTRIVLLEDFVGSGTQSIPVLQFAAQHFCEDIPVLFVPLVISELGLKRIRESQIPEALTIHPVFTIPTHVHVQEAPQANEPTLISLLRNIVNKTFGTVKVPMPPEEEELREAFGFGSVGTLLVIYTNCPNNTLPMIWHRAPNWSPLFPRISRS